MRKLKFRAYSKSFDIMFTNAMLEMATVSMVDICKEKLKKVQPDSTEIQTGIFLATYDEDLKIMQYTGLKDIDGKEIYEGDIIKHFDSNHKGVIKFGEYGCGKELSDIGYYINWFNEPYLRNDLGYWVKKGIKVIGNVFENLDLLEVEK